MYGTPQKFMMPVMRLLRKALRGMHWPEGGYAPRVGSAAHETQGQKIGTARASARAMHQSSGQSHPDCQGRSCGDIFLQELGTPIAAPAAVGW